MNGLAIQHTCCVTLLTFVFASETVVCGMTLNKIQVFFFAIVVEKLPGTFTTQKPETG